MITKNEIKYIRTLSAKKHRDEAGLFVAEGAKVIRDLLPLLECHRLYATKDFVETLVAPLPPVTLVTDEDLHKISELKTPRAGLALFRTPIRALELDYLKQIVQKDLCLALDGVQDPGNLGTIIRVADWFGIKHILASRDTADAFSPKVVQATMGAIGRVGIHYLDLAETIKNLQGIPVYGTHLDGDSIYSQPLTAHGLIVMGNEGNGISKAVATSVNRRLLIPAFPSESLTSESLNVAVATAIVCSEFRRRASLQ